MDINKSYNGLRFGVVLEQWLGFCNISKTDFAKDCDMCSAAISCVIRGRNGESGTNTPNIKSQDRYFRGLEKALDKYYGTTGNTMTYERFWEAPPAVARRQILDSLLPNEIELKKSSGTDIDSQILFKLKSMTEEMKEDVLNYIKYIISKTNN